MGVPRAAKVGRTYDDFQAYIEEHEIQHWVEMDTVVGRIGGKIIMTFHFTQMNFMFGLFLDNKISAEAAMIIFNFLLFNWDSIMTAWNLV